MYRYKQQGVALMVFAMLLLTIVGSTFLVNSRFINPELKSKQDSQKALSDAKQALINFSLRYFYNNPSGANFNALGRLPFPDRNQDSLYDGESDCSTAAAPISSNVLIGRFPWLSEGTPCLPRNINADIRDGDGERLWYAVSANLVRHTANDLLGFIPNTFPAPAAPPLIPLTNNWLTVYDPLGNILSNRVAFIVMSAGKAINGQVRNGVAPPVNRYLDSFTLPDSTIVNNADAILDFVTAPESTTFNDQLIYVTIDELMPLIEQRVLYELRALLLSHYQANANRYPFAADLGGPADINSDMTCVSGLLSGFISSVTDAAGTCPNLTIPPGKDYLIPWLPFIFYEVRTGCTAVPGCIQNQAGINGLSLDGGISDRDVVLMFTGNPIITPQTTPLSQTRVGVPPHIRMDYLDDLQNIANDQNYVTPQNSANNNDQIIAF